MSSGDGDVKERRRAEKAVGRSGVVVAGNGKLTLNRRRDVLNVTQKRLPYAERTFKTSPKR